jgi:hypothetical protein
MAADGYLTDPVTGEKFDVKTGQPINLGPDKPLESEAARLPDGVSMDEKSGDILGSDGKPLEIDPKTGFPVTDGKLLDPLTGHPLEIDDQHGLPIDPSTGALVDTSTGELLDPETMEPLELDDSGLPIDPKNGLMTDPSTGLTYNMDGQLADPGSGDPLRLDEKTGFPVDPVTDELVDPETGHLVDPKTRELLAFDAETGLQIDDRSGDLINPRTGQRFDAETLRDIAIPGGDPAQGKGLLTFSEGAADLRVEVDTSQDQEVAVQVTTDGDTTQKSITVEDGTVTIEPAAPDADAGSGSPLRSQTLV